VPAHGSHSARTPGGALSEHSSQRPLCIQCTLFSLPTVHSDSALFSLTALGCTQSFSALFSLTALVGACTSDTGDYTPAIEVSRYISAASALMLLREAEEARGADYVALHSSHSARTCPLAINVHASH
jgi:hypothetical protein